MTLDEHSTKDLMQIVLEHYLKHHEIVLKKLLHAQKATEMSMAKLQEMSDAGMPENIDAQWGEIITIFRDFGANEDELFGIEDLLGTVPTPIKQPYVELVENDKELQKLKSELKSDEYQKAREVVQKVQSEPNPISGLTAADYTESAEETDMVQAFKFTPHARKR